MKRTSCFLSAMTASLLLSCASQTAHESTSRRDGYDASGFFVVDCLLPGQVRKLGELATYITSRQPIKTTASDCEFRGGEYVAYDRANYASALKIWLPKAQAGDPEAQVYVGEVYEKGLGLTSDYKIAAQWYQKAAVQGNSRGQINLGYLYEKGLGVPKDKNKAMEWYRKSSGLAEANIPYAATLSAAEAVPSNYEINSLKSELQNSQTETKILLKQLKETQQQLTKQSGSSTNQQTIAALEKQYQQQIITLESKLSETEKRAQQIAEELQNNQSSSANAQRKLLDTQAKLASMEKRLLQFDKNFQISSTEKTQQQSQIAQIEAEKKRLEAQVKSLQQQSQIQSLSVKPTLEIIEPPFVQVRGKPTVTLRSVVEQRDIVGKVTASAGLLALAVNDKKMGVDKQGLFKASVPIRAGETPVSVVAVDKAGGRSVLDFIFYLDNAVQTPAEAVVPASTSEYHWQSLDFGRYYALIIGNNKYQKVPSLDTPINDAKTVERVLKQKYGFQTEVLLNATRYEILSALNKLRGKLTEKDNLLVYYAGHGELDKVNMRGHWLPVDADADNTANWISTISITDILNTMSVKHIMVVADSCYSGAMTRSSLARIDAGVSDEQKQEWLKAMLKAKSRTVLTSGGLKPVMDGGGVGDHSVFATAFINALEQNSKLLEGQSLYQRVSSSIIATAANYGIEQVPLYAPILHAGHESGEFFFRPKI